MAEELEAAEPGQKTRVDIPGVLPTLNELVDLGKSHWAQYARAKQKAERKIRWVVGWPFCQHHCYRVAYKYCRPDARTDPSNVHAGAEKVVLDALQDMGLLAGDGHGQHRGSSYTVRKVRREAARTEIEIKEEGKS